VAQGRATGGSRGTATVARLRARVGDTASRVVDSAEAARRRSQVVDSAFTAYERDRRSVGSVLAGAIAFRLFVYLLPLFLAIVTLLGVISSFSAEQPEQLAGDVGLSAYVVNTVATASEQSHESLWLLVPLCLWALYIGGLGALKVLRSMHALAWGQPVTRVRRGVSAACVMFGVAAGLIAVLAFIQWLRKESGGLGLTSTLLASVVFFGAWLLASNLLPHGDAPWQALIPGAVLVGLGMGLLNFLSVYWLSHEIQSSSQLYGSLGVAAAILAWLYLIGRLLVASAMLNASLWERRSESAGHALDGADRV
jgi:uncharacterized BrkB/YihY/UPF0761 family membrane protein